MEVSDGGLPETSRSEILQALEEFDEEHRGEGNWADWQSNRNHKYAIKHDGRLYPVKQIISMATGRPNQSFDGGRQANSYVKGYDFDIVRLRRETLSRALEEVLDIYVEIRESEPFSKTDEDGEKRRIWELFEEIEELLEETSVLSQRPHVEVKWSVGQGNWARVPWIAFLDNRETTTTQEGVYAVYLFRQDMSGVYLTYNQGVTRPKKKYGRDVGYAVLRTRAERLRRLTPSLKDEGFSLDGGIDLAADQGLGRDYEVSTVSHKLYEPGSVPNDEMLLEDLSSVLRAYGNHVGGRAPSGKRSVEPDDIDRDRLRKAVENVIRPAIADRGDLEENGRYGHIHHEIIPEATPSLTPEAIDSAPKTAVLAALGADTGLLSETHQRDVATEFFENSSPETIREELFSLLYGAEELIERSERFLGLGEKVSTNGMTTKNIDLDVASYLLALSDPEEYPFCRMSVYRPAVEALLGGKEKGSYHWDECIAHAQDFYRAALEVFNEEYEELPFNDLLHVHIAFELAEHEDRDSPWGEGTVEINRKTFSVPEGPPLDGRRIVKIAPGEGAKLWDDCKENGHIRVGWQDVGDLHQYESEEELQEAFESAFLGSMYDNQAVTTKKASEVWTLRELEPGDLVVANRGKSEVLAVGTVVEPGYEWKPDYDGYNHAVNVDWDTNYAQEIPQQSYWGMVTVRELSDEDLIERILNPSSPVPKDTYKPPPFEKIYESVREKGMAIDRRTLRRYHVSLRTRGFVILSGVSGTGKTWLTKLYAEAVNAKRLLQPVSPNWTTGEDLLGYYNPVDGQYHHTEVSRFLQKAEEAYRKAQAFQLTPPPYHLVLDEMNLARVEYYFATLLSKMEKRKREGTAKLQLGPDTEVLLPPNFSFIGTVNIDETTHSFADKVYDRAQLIEMKAPEERLREHLGEEPYAGVLMTVWDAISGVAPFAFRILDEITEYVDVAQDHGSSWEDALDEQLLQKVLPKLKGTEPEVGEALSQFLEAVPEETYPLSHAKAQSMLKDFRTHGFTSYF